eukprot:TRINITY_DN2502_c4_g1_i1.p3 TRINITY_DN2502_c4_g1~~TRINITY_DN2502_c4_g1_i1.p3  ORF type:complete len:101 (-),score=3.99 TRINITY_DN2502_c4_g1_i1:898-1200(-)
MAGGGQNIGHVASECGSRGCAATTGRLLGFIFFVLLGQSIGEIPRQTIRDWDEVAGDIMVQMLLNAMASRGVQHLSWMQDTASAVFVIAMAGQQLCSASV